MFLKVFQYTFLVDQTLHAILAISGTITNTDFLYDTRYLYPHISMNSERLNYKCLVRNIF